MIKKINLQKKLKHYGKNKPFDHCVIDNFFSLSDAKALENDFPSFNSNIWHRYDNRLENKRTLNDWNKFPETTYNTFSYLNSEEFVRKLSEIVGMKLYPDPGLHGGGWHIHGNGGNLNPHLDYSIHPKTKLQRKINLIIYLSKDLKLSDGGHLGLWSSKSDGSINILEKKIAPKFNRAVVFDTTQNSWHGLVSEFKSKKRGTYRKSLAIYYLAEPHKRANKRMRALFSPRDSQKKDKEIYKLIKKRVGINSSKQVYRK